MAKKVTTSDIARLAGVSQSAVSKILNQNPEASFSDDTVERVMRAAEQLGYRQREKRSTIVSKEGNSSKLVGVICPNTNNPYYSMTVHAVEQAAYRAGYRVFTCNTYRDTALEESYLHAMAQMGISGIIYTFLPNARSLACEISRQLPVVVIGDKSDDMPLDILELDSYKSGILIAEHLISLGHRDIAFLSTSLNQYNHPRTRRLQGVRDIMEQNGLTDHLHVKSVDVSMQSELNDLSTEYDIGYMLAADLVRSMDVTALIGANDMIAYGIIGALEELSLRVPEDYSVCGFDNNFPSAMSRIGLTTVDHHMDYKGHNAFDILLRKLQKKKETLLAPDGVIRVEYTPNLVVRQSTAAPRRKK